MRAGNEKNIRTLTGLKVDTYFSASKLTWLGRKFPELRAKLASAGREFVERHWSSREMARRLMELYEELVRTKRDDSTSTR